MVNVGVDFGWSAVSAIAPQAASWKTGAVGYFSSSSCRRGRPEKKQKALGGHDAWKESHQDALNTPPKVQLDIHHEFHLESCPRVATHPRRICLARASR